MLAVSGGLFCEPLFSAPSFSQLSFLPLFWRALFSLQLFSPVFSWRLALPFSRLSFLPALSWLGPFSPVLFSSETRHPPVALREQRATGPAQPVQLSRRLPLLREWLPLPLLPPPLDPLPAIRHRRRCRCIHPSHRPDRRESDHRSAYLLLRFCGHLHACAPRVRGIKTTDTETALFATARDYSMTVSRGSIVHWEEICEQNYRVDQTGKLRRSKGESGDTNRLYS